MGRKGQFLDNTVDGNFFVLIKSELRYLQKFKSMERFKQKLGNYLTFYNTQKNTHKTRAKLKGLSPVIHRQQALSDA